MPSHGSLSKAGKSRDRTKHLQTWREEIRTDRRGVTEKKRFKGRKMKNRKSPRVNKRRVYNMAFKGKNPRFKKGGY